MAKPDDTAGEFLAALKALPKPEQDAVVLRIARDQDLGQDLLDLAIIAARRDEPSRPFRDYVEERRDRPDGFLRDSLHH